MGRKLPRKERFAPYESVLVLLFLSFAIGSGNKEMRLVKALCRPTSYNDLTGW